MKKWLWIGGSFVLAVALIVGIFAFINATSTNINSAANNTALTQNGPRLWQEKEAPAYVPVQRDGVGLWRSVRVPPVSYVESLLEQKGVIPLNASPEERERAMQEWYQKGSKDANYGPDPRAYRQLKGGSGGALAIAVGDLFLMLQYATYSVISPEDCASILWKSADKAPEAAGIGRAHAAAGRHALREAPAHPGLESLPRMLARGHGRGCYSASSLNLP